jgi:hypothetical protein
MKIKFQIGTTPLNLKFCSMKIVIFLLFIEMGISITSCTKDNPTTPTVYTPTPPQPAPPFTQGIAFWTDEGSICLCNGDPIFISVNNTTQILDKYYYGRGVTKCDDNNAIRFSLLPGTYSWQAVRRSDTLKGSVIINANSCFLQEIRF